MSTTLFLTAGRFGLAPSVKKRASAGLQLYDTDNAGLITGDPAGKIQILSCYLNWNCSVLPFCASTVSQNSYQRAGFTNVNVLALNLDITVQVSQSWMCLHMAPWDTCWLLALCLEATASHAELVPFSSEDHKLLIHRPHLPAPIWFGYKLPFACRLRALLNPEIFIQESKFVKADDTQERTCKTQHSV